MKRIGRGGHKIEVGVEASGGSKGVGSRNRRSRRGSARGGLSSAAMKALQCVAQHKLAHRLVALPGCGIKPRLRLGREPQIELRASGLMVRHTRLRLRGLYGIRPTLS